MKIRIKFRKFGAMKFVGHLDIMRFFQKAIRRADIDICYSEGFSPHQIMSFAAPLGVGATSDGEYLDIEVRQTVSTEKAMAALNAVMVEGVEVTGYVKLPDNAKPAMSIVTAADYLLFYKEGQASPYSMSGWQEKIRTEFMDQESFSIVKKTRKSERTIDLKPLVYEFGMKKLFDKPAFFLKVSTGSNDNIKPELVVSSLYERCSLAFPEYALQIHRQEVYTAAETGSFLPLLAIGEEIR